MVNYLLLHSTNWNNLVDFLRFLRAVDLGLKLSSGFLVYGIFTFACLEAVEKLFNSKKNFFFFRLTFGLFWMNWFV